MTVKLQPNRIPVSLFHIMSDCSFKTWVDQHRAGRFESLLKKEIILYFVFLCLFIHKPQAFKQFSRFSCYEQQETSYMSTGTKLDVRFLALKAGERNFDQNDKVSNRHKVWRTCTSLTLSSVSFLILRKVFRKLTTVCHHGPELWNILPGASDLQRLKTHIFSQALNSFLQFIWNTLFLDLIY